MRSVIGNTTKSHQTNKRFIINNNIIENELRIGSTMELSIYRPTSVLNIYSTIFERLMYNRFIQFLFNFIKINLDLDKDIPPITPLLL